VAKGVRAFSCEIVRCLFFPELTGLLPELIRYLSVLLFEYSKTRCAVRVFVNARHTIQFRHPAMRPIFKGMTMKISARNVLEGKVVGVKKGATTSHVTIDVKGLIITASITNEAVDDLGLKAGGAAKAVIKASDVLVAVG